MTIRPSSLDALNQCPCFEPGDSEFASAGTARHRELYRSLSGADYFPGNNHPPFLLDEEDQVAVDWAASYIKLNAPARDYPLELEQRSSALLSDWTEISGTYDAACGPDLFDLKWRHRSYEAQMACYALMRFQSGAVRDETIRVHLLFGVNQKAFVYHLSHDAALEIVERIVAKTRVANPQPAPCWHCSFCALKLSCSAYRDRVNAVIAGREDWQLEQYHSTKIESEIEMGKALTLARQLKPWCNAVEEMARRMAVRNGTIPAGYELKDGRGKRYISSVSEAYKLAGVPEETFLECCDVRLATSQKYPDKKGLEDAYKAIHGTSLAQAKRTLKENLKSVTKTTSPQQRLVRCDGREEDSEANE